MYHVFRNQGQGPIANGLKSLDRFYDAMLPCPTVVLSGKDEFKIFQHCMYFGKSCDPTKVFNTIHIFKGVFGWCEGVMYLVSPGRPTDIGLQLGKACYR